MQEAGVEGRVYGGRSADERRSDRQRRLLDAALECFGTKGYAATTINDLCRSAGVAPAKFYEDAGSKEQLLIALCLELADEAMGAVSTAVQGIAGLEDMARQGLAAYCGALLQDPRKARVLMLEAVGGSPAVERGRHRILAGYSELLITYFAASREAAERPEPVPTWRARIVATALVGATNEAMVQWLRDEDRVTVEQLVETLAGVFTTLARWLAASAPEP